LKPSSKCVIVFLKCMTFPYFYSKLLASWSCLLKCFIFLSWLTQTSLFSEF
jgi:hypothetical protein